MRMLAFPVLLLAACSPSGQQPTPEQGANQVEPAQSGSADSGSLSGLYESGTAQQPNQLCMIEGKDSAAEFGLVVWGSNLHSCSGTGAARRSGESLELAMAGDSECVIKATMAGGKVTLPATLPQGCAYYCGARARMDGASFDRRGDTREDALKAKDLVGESLCGGGR